MNGKTVVLKIVGILSAIIVGCVILAIFVGAPLLRHMQYTNAVKNAENGQYVAAVKELNGRNMDEYKDSKQKKQEYVIAAAKQYMDEKNYEEAYGALKYAIEIDADTELTKEAEKLLKKVSKLIPYVD